MDSKTFTMKKKTFSLTLGALILAILVSCSATEYPSTGSVLVIDQKMNSIVAPGTLPEILAEGFEWSEGPLWLPAQKKVLFSDIPENSVFEWSEEEGLKLYLKPSGYTGSQPRGGELGSNGLLLDSEGKLVLCQHGDRRMARMTAQLTEPEAEFETLAGKWDGKRFNSPNDAVFKSNGDLYFTDPAYGMENRFQDTLREMDFTGVFKLGIDGSVTLLTDQLSAPNGIGFSPDENQLYVANSGGPSGRIWMVYDVTPNGTLSNSRLFYDAGAASDTLRGAPDGLVVREDGIIFATGPGGVWVLSPEGKHLGTILTGQATSNCTLDQKNRYLYMTADMYLMRIRLR
jgi:gluconolactonase